MTNTEPPQPVSPFTIHPSTTPFAVPCRTYLSTLNTAQDFKHAHIATGALVFNTNTTSNLKILLIQRAAHDSMPLRWETPGGACDDEDESILHGVARELVEETGLAAVRIGPVVGRGYSFLTRGGRLVRKLNFVVECDNESGMEGWVRLDPREHQGFVWATEEEVVAKRVGDLELRFTTGEQEDVVLEGFRVKRELEGTRN